MTLQQANKTGFCVMPFVHFHVANNGKVPFCCEARGAMGDVNQQPVRAIWNSELFQEARHKMLAGEKLWQCEACYAAERAGDESLRQESNKRFAHHLHETASKPQPEIREAPLYWDIRFSNICNLRCRTCWHGNSSAWYGDARRLHALANPRPLFHAIEDESAFFQEVEELLDCTAEWFWAGGEPFFMPAHERVLQQLLDRGMTGVHLRYHTNLMAPEGYLKKAISYLRHFRRITFGLSIDHTGEKEAFVRKGSNWEVQQRRLKVLKAQLPQAAFEWVPVVSIFNILDFAELYRRLIRQQVITPGTLKANILKQPAYYSIRILPRDLKNQASAALQELMEQPLAAKGNDRAELRRLINWMMSASWEGKIRQFQRRTAVLDRLRGEDFGTLFPELKRMVYA